MILISVGRLDEQKGYVRLLNVCAKLNKLFDFELWIIGDGKDRDKLENKIEAFSLNNVVLWGNQSNPYPLIKKADWFISSSYWESYGLALQEALILGVPVLATTCPSFEECVSEKEAILVQNDEDALYDGLYRILSEPKLNQVYRENINRDRTHDHYFEGRMEAIEGLWKQNM